MSGLNTGLTFQFVSRSSDQKSIFFLWLIRERKLQPVWTNSERFYGLAGEVPRVLIIVVRVHDACRFNRPEKGHRSKSSWVHAPEPTFCFRPAGCAIPSTGEPSFRQRELPASELFWMHAPQLDLKRRSRVKERKGIGSSPVAAVKFTWCFS